MRSDGRGSRFAAREATEPSLRVIDDGPIRVCALAGEIDISSIRGLGNHILLTMPPSARGLVIDLTDVEFLDSTGVSLLFELRRELRSGGRSLGLVLPESSPLWRLFHITQLPVIIAVSHSVPEAKALIGEA